MSRGIRIGSVVGAPVVVSAWWFVIAALLTLWVSPFYEDWLPGQGKSGQYLLGALFVVLLYLSAFLHELGHALSARAFGLRVHRIELTALGGLTQMDTPPTPGRSAATSAAGPAVNVVLVGVALVAIAATTDNTLPHLFAAQLAWTNGLLAVFNLLPGLPLDGGSILRAGIWRATGRTSTATIGAAWAGRAVAGLLVLWFLHDVVAGGTNAAYGGLFTLLVAYWMWSSSTAALNGARARAAVPRLSARGLARPVVTVAADEPVSVVMRRIADENARGAVVTDHGGHVTGIVSEASVAAAPRDRWPWITASDVARRLAPELDLDANLAGEDLMRALAVSPATEYLLREADGRVAGVLAFADVEAALSRR